MTGETPFNIAMALLRKVSDDGTISETDTAKFRAQAPGVITILQNELLRASGSASFSVSVIEALTDTLTINDMLATSPLPYGLASHLIIEKKPELASYYNQKYDEFIKKFCKNVPMGTSSVTDAYDVSLTYTNSGW